MEPLQQMTLKRRLCKTIISAQLLKKLIRPEDEIQPLHAHSHVNDGTTPRKM